MGEADGAATFEIGPNVCEVSGHSAHKNSEINLFIAIE